MTERDDHLDDARRDDLAAYALGALPEDEASVLDLHLAHCDRCRTHLRSMAPALDALTGSVPQESPPAHVRERLMATVRAEAEAETRMRPNAGSTRPWWSRIGAPALRPAMGLAAILLLAAGVGAGYLLGGAGERPEGGSTSVVNAEPSAGTAGAARLEVRGDSAVLTVGRLPELPANRVYQVWIERGEVMEPSTLFVLDDNGSGIAAVPDSLQGAQRVLVTAEPRGGSEQPTSSPVLTATLG